MSVDLLQEKIRKLKNPSMVSFALDVSQVPPQLILEEQAPVEAWTSYALGLLDALRGLVPAVRFCMGSFALHGKAGMDALERCVERAGELGFYVAVDGPELTSAPMAKLAAEALTNAQGWHAMVIGVYPGSDVVKPFVNVCKSGKAVFCVARTGNKSAPELQDLLTGSRLVHTAAADMVNRYGETILGRYGYSQLGVLLGAAGGSGIKSLRPKYPTQFFLIDGYDWTGANAKNCSYGFDKLGHGAVACAAESVTAAWKEAPEGEPYAAAVAAAERMKRALTRYVTVL